MLNLADYFGPKITNNADIHKLYHHFSVLKSQLSLSHLC